MTRLEDLRQADYLDHIVQAIDEIVEWTTGMDYTAFVENRIVRAAVVRNLEIVGEACAQLLTRFPEFAEQHTDMPLRQARGMRNRIIHGYFDVRWDQVWSTVMNDLVFLRGQAGGLRRELDLPPEAGGA